MYIIIGLIIILIGFLLIAKAEWFLNNFGRIGFFEQHLSTEGGTRLGYRLLGMLVIFIGMLVLTNLLGGLAAWMLGPYLRMYN